MQVLRRMYGPAIPDPTRSIATRWGTDPFSLGSYSFYRTGNPKNITAALAEPFGRVYFGGEAASSNPGTAHGASRSGIAIAGTLQVLLEADSVAATSGS